MALGIECRMADAARILEEALTLSANERARLAHELIHSLEPDDPDASVAWSSEIRRRIDEIEAGTAKLEDWDSVKARLEAASRR
jgi:putative addiction module component (TIGR02574 family)